MDNEPHQRRLPSATTAVVLDEANDDGIRDGDGEDLSASSRRYLRDLQQGRHNDHNDIINDPNASIVDPALIQYHRERRQFAELQKRRKYIMVMVGIGCIVIVCFVGGMMASSS